MLIIPAIDIKEGKCVRLRQGRANAVSVYGHDPVAMAQHWEQEGAKYLHVVDLDGAFQGRPVHGDLIARIVKAVHIPIEVGGGLRTDEDLQAMLDRGVDRVIVGTRACADPASLSKLADRFGVRLAVGIDARGGRVQIKGWVEATLMRAVDLALRAQTAGVRWIIYTDTSKDGMLTGPDVAAVGEMCDAVSCQIIASGGVSSPQDVAALRKLKRANLAGVIVGRALYEQTVTLKALES